MVIFRAFLFIFFRPPDPRSEKKSRKLTNKKILPDPGDSEVRTNSEDSLLSENDDSSDNEAPLELDCTGKRYVIPHAPWS